ncbi:MAG TPA: alcohol dehydrogenase catalytic domain-containing protein [Armatimonadota bacterium]|jgi:threonine dehydrogenase-like Zn-dependent dehydrogenase
MDALVRVRACAISAQDVRAFRTGSEITPGTEVVGVVAALGDDAARMGIAEGARVAVHRHAACGECALCLRGRTNLCRHRLRPDTGVGVDGGYAEFLTAHIRQLIPLDPGISWEQGLMLLETVGSPLHGLRRAHIWNHPERIGNALILGAPPTGLAAAAVLAAVGVPNIAVLEAAPYRRELARADGASVFPPLERATDHALIAFARDGFDLVIDVSNEPDLRDQGFRHIADGGVLLVVGENNAPFSVSLHSDLGLREKSVVGSEYFPIREFSSNESLVLSSRLRPERLISHRFSLEDILPGFESFSAGLTGAVLVSSR